MSAKKQLILGRAGSGKSYLCLKMVCRQLQQELPGTIFLLPNSQMIRNVERQLLENFPAAGIKGRLLYQFSDLWKSIGAIAGNQSARLISEDEKRCILQHIISRTNLDYFRPAARYDGFARSLGRLMKELKQNLISPENLEKQAKIPSSDAGFARKTSEISLIYHSYNNFLNQHKLIDAEDYSLKALNIIRREREFLNRFSLLVLDGFSSFTGLEFEFLKELIGGIDEVVAALCYDEEDPAVFGGIRQTYRRLCSLCRWEEIKLDQNQRADGVLAHIETSLFRGKINPIYADDSLHIIQASSPTQEVETVARAIRKEVAEKGIKFSDIGILLRSTDDYTPLIRRVFDRFKIPYLISGQEKLCDVPLVRTTRQLLKLLTRNFDPETFLSLMKSAHFDFDPLLSGQIHNYSLKYGLRKEEDWRKNWQADEDFPSEIISQINQAKTKLFEMLDQWRIPLQNGSTLAEFEKVILNILYELSCRNSLRLETPQQTILFHRREGYAVAELMKILESIKNHYRTIESESPSCAELVEKIEDALSGRKFSLPPFEKDFVHISNVYESRLPEYRVTFVMGLVERKFPPLIRDDPFFKDSERLRVGRHLSQRRARADMERYLFYIACTRCTRRLYLTCHNADLEGKETPVSHYLDEIKKLFTAETLNRQTRILPVGRLVPNTEDIITMRDIENFTAQKLRQPSENQSNIEIAVHLYNKFLSPNQRARETLAEGLQRRQVKLSDVIIRRLRQPSLWTSISRLATYGECPFRYFVEGVLDIKSREEMQFRALEEGELCHSVLRQLMKNIYSDKKANIESFPLDQLLDRAEKMVDRYIDRRFPRLLESGLEKVRSNRIVSVLQNFIAKERRNQQQNQTTPRYFELAFSKPREEEQQDEKSIQRVLEIDCGDGLSLFLAGRIDRVDVFFFL